MMEKFFSVDYADRGDLFQGLAIWENEKYRGLQGTFPVLFISFADIKETTFEEARKKICMLIQLVYNKFDFLLESDVLNENEKRDFRQISSRANTSSNNLVGTLIREGSPEIKMTMESLLRGETFSTTFDEQIVFNQFEQEDGAVWSLLLASGYLRAVHYEFNIVRGRAEYVLKLTNMEVRVVKYRILEVDPKGIILQQGRNYQYYCEASAWEQYALLLVICLYDGMFAKKESYWYPESVADK